ncbi:alpha/beta fold hydrolase [Sphingomonas cavernae]|uniref:Alpha/beta fold hydrolase n=2 Tax=Sphingomonas cavernae TaxID=2320861 RepID=A0A418WNI4_9SPHN|nr:alpha/beta fold hydrolase [Sphingomonas cavernae]RJF91564.1 alpha/beta fold hydrolase [Sphingomonas cavernae]
MISRAISALLLAAALPATAQTLPTKEADAVLKNFTFRSGEKLGELRIHYTTLGTPHRGAKGEIDNAVMVLHGTGGSGKQFLSPQFAGELYGPGQPLDITRYYVILPDNIGHGASSKPSDGMKMAFPKYDYDDMVEAQRRMLGEGLKVTKLKLILGTSMGCMHAFVWGQAHPGFAERLAPFACLPVEIAGMNRMWRKMAIDGIKADPTWNGGNYTAQPPMGLRTAADLLILAGANPLALQQQFPTRAQAEANLEASFDRTIKARDANDLIYQLDASRTYNPWPGLEKITAPMLWINSADDFINPPGYGITEAATKRLKSVRFILIPATAETKGHGTHTWAKFWKDDLAKLMAE